MDRQGSDLSLEEALARFISTLSLDERWDRERELSQFVQWCGRKQAIGRLIPADIAKYGEWIMASTTDAPKKLAPVREFLSYARKNGWTKTNLAPHIRARKGSIKFTDQVRRSPGQHAVLTQQGLSELKARLAALEEERSGIIEEVRRARADKDFRENAPLDAAREAQAQIEGRIRELEATIKSAVVLGQGEVEGSKVSLGSSLVLCDLSSGEKVGYTLVDPREASIENGRLSITSPVGRALLNCREGDVVEVSVPMGKLRYRIERIEK